MTNETDKKRIEFCPLPHRNLFAGLKQSKIHGIGLFAIREIKKGVDIFPDTEDEIIWIDASILKTLQSPVKKLYNDYCVIKSGKYGCPKSFNLLTPSWYINHSSKPNLRVDLRYRIYALRNIKRGEELTLDYTTYMEIKIPRSWK